MRELRREPEMQNPAGWAGLGLDQDGDQAILKLQPAQTPPLDGDVGVGAGCELRWSWCEVLHATGRKINLSSGYAAQHEPQQNVAPLSRHRPGDREKADRRWRRRPRRLAQTGRGQSLSASEIPLRQGCHLERTL